MTNIYLINSDEEAIVDFVKDHEELCNKTNNKYFKDKSRKECLSDRFTRSHNLSVKVCKTWFESQMTSYGKLTYSKSGKTPKEMTDRQKWIQDKFNFLKTQIRRRGLGKPSAFKSSQKGNSAAAAHNISQQHGNQHPL